MTDTKTVATPATPIQIDRFCRETMSWGAGYVSNGLKCAVPNWDHASGSVQHEYVQYLLGKYDFNSPSDQLQLSYDDLLVFWEKALGEGCHSMLTALRKLFSLAKSNTTVANVKRLSVQPKLSLRYRPHEEKLLELYIAASKTKDLPLLPQMPLMDYLNMYAAWKIALGRVATARLKDIEFTRSGSRVMLGLDKTH